MESTLDTLLRRLNEEGRRALMPRLVEAWSEAQATCAEAARDGIPGEDPAKYWTCGLFDCSVCREWFKLAVERGYADPGDHARLCSECGDCHICSDYEVYIGDGFECSVCGSVRLCNWDDGGECRAREVVDEWRPWGDIVEWGLWDK